VSPKRGKVSSPKHCVLEHVGGCRVSRGGEHGVLYPMQSAQRPRVTASDKRSVLALCGKDEKISQSGGKNPTREEEAIFLFFLRRQDFNDNVKGMGEFKSRRGGAKRTSHDWRGMEFNRRPGAIRTTFCVVRLHRIGKMPVGVREARPDAKRKNRRKK